MSSPAVSVGPVFKTPEDGHYFQGYYYHSAICKKNEKILSHKAAFIDRMPSSNDRVLLGWFELNSPKQTFRAFSETSAWNWQQGSMLQWLGPDHCRRVIFNDFRQGRYVSVIYDLDTHIERVAGRAIYAVSHDGRLAIGLDVLRHFWYRNGYAYQCTVDPTRKIPCDVDDGLWSLDLVSGHERQIIRVGDLLDINHLATMDGAEHVLEHAMFSPDGSSLNFLHRWKQPDGSLHTRLYACRIDGSGLKILNDSGRMTHCCWLNENEILGWGSKGSLLTSLRNKGRMVRRLLKMATPIYRKLVRSDSERGNSAISRAVSGDSYLLINSLTASVQRVAPDQLTCDGHPSRVPGRPGVFITDTYPDKDGNLTLMLVCPDREVVRNIASLRSIPSLDRTPLRCDLHPKVSFDGSLVAIDTMNDGIRSVYAYRLPD